MTYIHIYLYSSDIRNQTRYACGPLPMMHAAKDSHSKEGGLALGEGQIHICTFSRVVILPIAL